MKKWVITFLFSTIVIFTSTNYTALADVIDKTKTKSIQSYDDLYTLIAEYKGTSGVTIRSYSPLWNTQEKLKAVEVELLKNKHGEELALLGRIEIYPDYPSGKTVLGEYHAEYEHAPNEVKLLPNRVIQLFGGDEYSTVNSIATTLSHEYGHHFTYYHILDGEDKLPEDWMAAQYTKHRGLLNTKVHDDVNGEYEWMIHEIAAEDYVQLFGSDAAIKNHTPANVVVGNPFDANGVFSYYAKRFNSSDYLGEFTIPFYLIEYNLNPYDSSFYNLQFYATDLRAKRTYLSGQEGTGVFSGVQLDVIENVPDFKKWYEADKLPNDVAWVLDSYSNSNVNYKLLQYQEVGFNRGSKTLAINYSKIEDSKTNEQTLNLVNELSVEQIKTLLQEAAAKHNIPAEILKAIAYIETGLKQFDNLGNPIITADGGIGIMQVTLTEAEMLEKNIDRNQLERNTAYNIEIGAQILKEKWNWANTGRIPKINEHNPEMIEHWYFAVMAYNGLSKRNDPNIEQEKLPYQDRVFEAIQNLSLIQLGDIPPFEIDYPNSEVMNFPIKQYDWPKLNTMTTQNLQVGAKLYTNNKQAMYSNLRDGIDGAIIQKVPHYTPFEIIGGPYQPAVNASNHYVIYKVKSNSLVGYMASSNIAHADVIIFPDISYDPELVSAVTYLNLHGIINGHSDGTYKPYDRLLRRHAASILVNALQLELPKGYVPKQKDMNPMQLGYVEMTIAEAHGLIGQGSDYRPNEYLTRAQMASILVRAYKNTYVNPSTKKDFVDIDTTYYNYEDINTLYFNGISIVDSFKPQSDVTRAHFALFLKRTLNLQN